MEEITNKAYPKQNILRASDNMKTEYCCNIIRVGTLTPIEGSDFLAQTFINGESVVVRKDQVHEGDIFFFAMNECQLMPKFLKANSLYRENNAEENANYKTDVLPLKDKLLPIQEKIMVLKARIKKFERARRLLTHVSDPDAIDKFNIIVHELFPDNPNFLLSVSPKEMQTDVINTCIDEHKKEMNEVEAEQKDISQKIARKCGFFEKNGRVRAIKLKGTPSFGYMFSQDEMAKAYPEIMKLNLEDYIGLDFDTVSDELFTKAYVPKLTTPAKGNAKAKNAKIYEQMIEGEFAFHYDTEPLGKNIWKISPYDSVTISNKIHGVSLIFSHVKAKYPAPLKWYEKLANNVLKFFHFDESRMIKRWDIRYAEIPSSRKVIKDPELNPQLNSGYYAIDIWNDWAEKLKGKVPKDMSIYGEIMGYETGTDRPLQKPFDYGAKPGENFLMIYRITEINRETGEKREWNVDEVYNWTMQFIKDYPELKPIVHPIDIFYHGPFNELYPDIPVDNKWHDNVLQRMAADKELFGMELNEPLCVNKVPREGLVIRVDNDKVPRAYKLKTVAFRDFEQKQIDAGQIDSEMGETYN